MSIEDIHHLILHAQSMYVNFHVFVAAELPNIPAYAALGAHAWDYSKIGTPADDRIVDYISLL